MQDHVFVEDYAHQFFPTWLAVLILIALAWGLWKLVKNVRAARSRARRP
jgi:hypothetical protein